jgi:hypothetical protein
VNETEQLIQWLRDFASANEDSFAPEQIARLVDAADAISTLDEAVDALIVERDELLKEISNNG